MLRKRTIFIAGDSTAEKKIEDERPESGWGEFLVDYLPESYQVKNYAKGGRSTKSFLNQNRLKSIMNEIQKDDYLVIQFGHNDQKIDDSDRYADAGGSYQDNLIYFIEQARKHQAQPILISSINRREFINGKLNSDSLGDYPKAMRHVAINQNVPFIDMNAISIQLLESLGEIISKDLHLHLTPGKFANYPNGLIDNTHFSEFGAKTYAKLIAKELLNYI